MAEQAKQENALSRSGNETSTAVTSHVPQSENQNASEAPKTTISVNDDVSGNVDESQAHSLKQEQQTSPSLNKKTHKVSQSIYESNSQERPVSSDVQQQLKASTSIDTNEKESTSSGTQHQPQHTSALPPRSPASANNTHKALSEYESHLESQTSNNQGPEKVNDCSVRLEQQPRTTLSDSCEASNTSSSSPETQATAKASNKSIPIQPSGSNKGPPKQSRFTVQPVDHVRVESVGSSQGQPPAQTQTAETELTSNQQASMSGNLTHMQNTATGYSSGDELVRIPGGTGTMVVKEKKGRFKLLGEETIQASASTGLPVTPAQTTNAPNGNREHSVSGNANLSNLSNPSNIQQTIDGTSAPIFKKKGRFVVTNVRDPGVVAVPVQAVVTQVAPANNDVSQQTTPQNMPYTTQAVMVAQSGPIVQQPLLYSAATPPMAPSGAQPPFYHQPSISQAALFSAVPSTDTTHGQPAFADSAQGQNQGTAIGDEDPDKPNVPRPKGTQPSGQQRKNASVPTAARTNGGLAGQAGLGKVFYFLEQMRLEVTEADRTIKKLQSDMKFLKEKNKELEAKARDTERKFQEEKALRESAEKKCRGLKKKLRALNVETEVSKDVLEQHSRSNSLENVETASYDGSKLALTAADQDSTLQGPELSNAATNLEDSVNENIGVLKQLGTSPQKGVFPSSEQTHAPMEDLHVKSGESMNTPTREASIKETISSYPPRPQASSVSARASTTGSSVQQGAQQTQTWGVMRSNPNSSLPPMNGISGHAGLRSMQGSSDHLSAVDGVASTTTAFHRSDSLGHVHDGGLNNTAYGVSPSSSPRPPSGARKSVINFDPLNQKTVTEACEPHNTVEASSQSAFQVLSTTPLYMMQQQMAVPIVSVNSQEGAEFVGIHAQSMNSAFNPSASEQTPTSRTATLQDLQQTMLLVPQSHIANLQDISQQTMMTIQLQESDQWTHSNQWTHGNGTEEQGQHTSQSSWNQATNQRQQQQQNPGLETSAIPHTDVHQWPQQVVDAYSNSTNAHIIPSSSTTSDTCHAEPTNNWQNDSSKGAGGGYPAPTSEVDWLSQHDTGDSTRHVNGQASTSTDPFDQLACRNQTS